MGTSWTCSHLVRSADGLGILEFVTGILGGTVLLGTMPSNLWRLMLTPGVCIRFELSCHTQRLTHGRDKYTLPWCSLDSFWATSPRQAQFLLSSFHFFMSSFVSRGTCVLGETHKCIS